MKCALKRPNVFEVKNGATSGRFISNSFTMKIVAAESLASIMALCLSLQNRCTQVISQTKSIMSKTYRSLRAFSLRFCSTGITIGDRSFCIGVNPAAARYRRFLLCNLIPFIRPPFIVNNFITSDLPIMMSSMLKTCSAKGFKTAGTEKSKDTTYVIHPIEDQCFDNILYASPVLKVPANRSITS